MQLECKYINASSSLGTKYRIAYNFKQGYTYFITLNAAELNNTAGSSTGPFLRLDLTNYGGGGGTICQGPQTIQPNLSGNPAAVQYSITSFADVQFAFSTPLSSAFSMLEVSAIPAFNSTGTNSIRIRKMTILEVIPTPAFTLPSSTTFSCGSTIPQTFTVANVNNTTGITDYTWDLSSAGNGWLYNGSAAAQTISTGTNNTITLTPVCGSTQSNIKAVVTANGNTYNTNSSAITYTQPTYSISGSNVFCSGSSVYTVTGLPCNGSVTWSADPASGIVNMVQNNNEATLTKQNDGVVKLTATITNPNACSSATVIKSITVTVGTPKIIAPSGAEGVFTLTGERFNYIGPGANYIVCPGENLIFSPYFPNDYTSPLTGHQWTISGSFNATGSLNLGSLFVTAPSSPRQYFNFTYQYQNICGWSPLYYGYAGTMDCDAGEEPDRIHPSEKKMTGPTNKLSSSVDMLLPTSKEIANFNDVNVIFPNPARDIVNVTVNSKTSETILIKIYNLFGEEIRKVKTSSQTTSINVADLPNGVYFIKVHSGQKLTTHKIIKN